MDVRQYAKIPVFIEEDHHDVRYFYVELLNEVFLLIAFLGSSSYFSKCGCKILTCARKCDDSL